MAQITLNSTGVASSGSLVLQSNGTTSALTIDTAQNLGLGVTPSAWNLSGFTALQNKNASLGGYLNRMYLSANTYHDGTNWKYIASDYAGQYSINTSGQHQWYIAGSGTAGGTISWTQAMTLDASGNLGVGTTSPAAKLDVAAGSSSTFAKFSSSNADPYFRIQNTSAGGKDWIIYSSGTGSSLPGTFRLFNNTDNLTAFTVDSSGNLLVGATSTTGLGTSSHNFVGKAASDYSIGFNSTFSTASQNYGVIIKYTAAAPNGSLNEFLQCSDSSALRAKILSNGGLANYSANNVNLSDRREKTNFAPAGNYLAKICAIPVQTYNYIDQNLEEDDGLTLGVVAQDVQSVAPELVMESNWGTKDEPKMRLSIYQTDLQYALMKCIQEQQALIASQSEIITQLQVDVAALKAK